MKPWSTNNPLDMWAILDTFDESEPRLVKTFSTKKEAVTFKRSIPFVPIGAHRFKVVKITVIVRCWVE